MNNKKRKTCSICRKKRYIEFLKEVRYIDVNIYYWKVRRSHVCKNKCFEKHLEKLSNLNGQIEIIINYLST